MRSTRSTLTAAFRPPAASVALALLLAGSVLLVPGCRPAQRTEPPAKPYPSVVAEVPRTPVVADAGSPGTWEALEGIEPGVRAFVVGPADAAPASGVVLVSSSWGISRETRDLARSLAARGFAVVIPDVLEGIEATSRLGMKELTAGVSLPRAQAVILAGLARLQRDLPGKPIALVTLGGADRWVISLAEKAQPFAALAFDSAALGDKEIASLAAAGRPVLALFGDESSAYPLERRIALDETARRAGLALQLYPVPGAGTELFDAKANSFSAVAYDEALARLEAFLRAPTP